MFPFILVVCMIAAVMDDEKAEITTQADFISEQSTDRNYSSPVASAAKPKTRFDINKNGLLVRVSPLGGASQ